MGNSNKGAMFARDCTIAQDSLIPGTTYQDLADKYEVSKSLISYILKKDHIREIIDTAQQELIAFTPLAIDRFLSILKDKDHSDHYKAIRDQLQTIGILASHTGGNTYIQNIFNASQTPDVIDVNRFRDMIVQRQDQDVIEGEYTDETINPGDPD